jgi:hypothetical protein
VDWVEIVKIAVIVISALFAAYQTWKKMKADKDKENSEVVTKTILEFVENLDKHFVKGTTAPTMEDEEKARMKKEGETTKHLVKNLIEKHAVKKGVNYLIESALDKFVR